jgi:hypothetical protein
MRVPRIWVKLSADAILPADERIPVSAWGWGDNTASANQCGAARLQRAIERALRGDRERDSYAYGDRPLREEILRTFEGSRANEPTAIVTRNGDGAIVLNVARLLFLDVDFPPANLLQLIRRLFGGPSAEDKATHELGDALREYGRARFRVYRTAFGLRAIAVDREFDPAGEEAQSLMRATRTDPAFARLCKVQQSFRARLTPKYWRCKLPPPPGQYPRDESEVQERYADWLREYEATSASYATCRYLETIGNGTVSATAVPLIALHDQITRCNESLPLA